MLFSFSSKRLSALLITNTLGDLAYNESMYVLTRMVQTFKELRSDDLGPWIEDISMACKSKNGAKVTLIPVE